MTARQGRKAGPANFSRGELGGTSESMWIRWSSRGEVTWAQAAEAEEQYLQEVEAQLNLLDPFEDGALAALQDMQVSLRVC